MYRYIAIKTALLLLAFTQPVTALAYQLDSFEIRNGPLADFVEWVSTSTGENIILGRGVHGTVSVHVQSIDSSEVLAMFTEVMNANGYGVTYNKHGFYRVTIDKTILAEIPKRYTKVYKLRHVRNTKALDIVNTVLSAANPQTPNETHNSKTIPINSLGTTPHTVQALPATNGILVTGTESQLKNLDAFINQIDTNIPQVVIEAAILETDLGNNEKLGLNFSTALAENGFSAVSSTLDRLAVTGTSGVGYLVFSRGANVRGFVAALVNNTSTKILSTPNIVVLDREHGIITVGQNVPFLLSKETGEGGTTIQQIERKDVGVSLSVKPHVLGDGQVILDIHQESSSVSNSTVAADVITNKRSITTFARMEDGQTIVLGGLVSEENRTIETGIPVLKDIPWIGRLFRSETTDKVQRELTVMIKIAIL